MESEVGKARCVCRATLSNNASGNSARDAFPELEKLRKDTPMRGLLKLLRRPSPPSARMARSSPGATDISRVVPEKIHDFPHNFRLQLTTRVLARKASGFRSCSAHQNSRTYVQDITLKSQFCSCACVAATVQVRVQCPSRFS